MGTLSLKRGRCWAAFTAAAATDEPPQRIFISVERRCWIICLVCCCVVLVQIPQEGGHIAEADC